MPSLMAARWSEFFSFQVLVQRKWNLLVEMRDVVTRMNESDHLPLDERKDGRQFAQLSLGVHLLQRRRDEVVVEAVERQELTTV